MEQKKLNAILDDHKLWIESYGEEGMRAHLKGADLRGANLKGANLKCADLKETNLEGTNLRGADLRGASLKCAYLQYANLEGANLIYAHLQNAHLEGANLEGTNLRCAYLENADLENANLEGANLRCADLSGANVKNATLPPSLDNLPEGELIGYKKVKDCIVKLRILADSKRSRATSDKCRCDKALVLAIETPNGTDSGLKQIVNYNFALTTYKVGEIVYADSWDEDRWNECSHGIHFFLDRHRAVSW